MARFRNDTGFDKCVLGFHFHSGNVVDIPDDLDPQKLEYFRRNFTEVSEEEPAPAVEEPAPDPVEAPLIDTEEVAEPSASSRFDVTAPCGAEAPPGHEDPLAWRERHMTRCKACREE